MEWIMSGAEHFKEAHRHQQLAHHENLSVTRDGLGDQDRRDWHMRQAEWHAQMAHTSIVALEAVLNNSPEFSAWRQVFQSIPAPPEE